MIAKAMSQTIWFCYVTLIVPYSSSVSSVNDGIIVFHQCDITNCNKFIELQSRYLQTETQIVFQSYFFMNDLESLQFVLLDIFCKDLNAQPVQLTALNLKWETTSRVLVVRPTLQLEEIRPKSAILVV